MRSDGDWRDGVGCLAFLVIFGIVVKILETL